MFLMICLDLESDRAHLRKRDPPFASGDASLPRGRTNRVDASHDRVSSRLRHLKHALLDHRAIPGIDR